MAAATNNAAATTWTEIIAAGGGTEFIVQPQSQHVVEVQFGTSAPAETVDGIRFAPTAQHEGSRCPIPESTDKVFARCQGPFIWVELTQ